MSVSYWLVLLLPFLKIFHCKISNKNPDSPNVPFFREETLLFGHLFVPLDDETEEKDKILDDCFSARHVDPGAAYLLDRAVRTELAMAP